MPACPLQTTAPIPKVLRRRSADWSASCPGPLPTTDDAAKPTTKPPHRPLIAGDIGWGVQSAMPSTSAQVR